MAAGDYLPMAPPMTNNPGSPASTPGGPASMGGPQSSGLGLVAIQTPAQVTAAKNKKDEEVAGVQQIEEAATKLLAGHIRKVWWNACRARIPIEDKMLMNLRQVQGIYEPDVLAAIQQVDAPVIYAMLTDAKCRSAIAWIKEVLIQPNDNPWDIEPTPEPDLPQSVINQIKSKFIQETFSSLMMTAAQSGQQIDPTQAFSMVRQMLPEFEAEMDHMLKKISKDVTEKLKSHVDDDLIEGGWYAALEECLTDIVQLKAGFIKGPVQRMETVKTVEQSGESKGFKIKYEEKQIAKYEWRSAWNIYPAVDSIDINDGDLIDKISIRRSQLEKLKGLPGFNDDEIDAVLAEHARNGLREWTRIAAELMQIQVKQQWSMWMNEKIDCLEYWGNVPGSLLVDWGMHDKGIEPLKQYDIVAWLIGAHVIKATLNENPLGKKAFYKASFKEIPGVFWGDGLPELIADIQRACNACFRAILHNIGIASGPQVEVDSDRLSPGEATKIWPWRVWLTKNEAMLNTPAVTFWAPPIVTERLINAYEFFNKKADEYCGIPAYAHGDTQVGGGGNTASGMSMLISQASRGIKAVIKSIDRKIIEPSVTAQFELTIETEKDIGIIPDYAINAKGSASLIAKEQQAIRRTEFLQMTNNPMDAAIMGKQGRKYLLEDAGKALDLDPDKLLPDNPENPIPPAPGQPGAPQPGNMGQPSQPNARALDVSGQPSQGQDFRQFNAR